MQTCAQWRGTAKPCSALGWSKILFALVKAKVQASFIYVADSKSKAGFNLMLALVGYKAGLAKRNPASNLCIIDL